LKGKDHEAAVDTCTFLWMADDAPELSTQARTLVTNPDNEVYLSAASEWEIAIKHMLGKLSLPEPPRQFVPTQRTLLALTALSIKEATVLALDRLPALHRDPFDRILVCQALTHGLVIVSPDPQIQQYPISTLW
jgi:PIN domain nuclease of toxin-antitoxin system